MARWAAYKRERDECIRLRHTDQPTNEACPRLANEQRCALQMNDFNEFFDGEWSGDLDDLEWNEFHWERYLREQDEQPHRYLAFYETLLKHPKRTDEVARRMGWAAWNRKDDEDESTEGPTDRSANESNTNTASGTENPADAAAATTPPPALPQQSPNALPHRAPARLPHEPPFSPDDASLDSDVYYEVYTPQRNPLFIATRALYLRLRRTWELLASTPGKVSTPLAIRYLATLQRGEDHAMQAIQSMDCGEYALSISLFKRGLASLNESHALLNEADTPAARSYAEEMRVSLFDLRAIWLQVIGECRQEIEYWLDDEEDD